MKHIVPAPPQSSFAATSPRKEVKSSVAPKSIAALDAAFLGRVARTTVWFGAVLTVVVGVATRSGLAASSFAVGALLAVALLKSQQMLVDRMARRVLKTKTSNGIWWTRVPLAILLPAKYLLIAIGIAVSLRLHILVPSAFAAGFTVLQVVIFAKVFARLALHNLRPLREVYVTDKTNGF